MVFVLTGHIIPYVRMTQKGKWTPRAQDYLASQDAIKVQLIQQITASGWPMLSGHTPLSVQIEYWVPKVKFHNHDVDNTLKAILDAMSGIVYPDDRWIDYIQIARNVGDKYAAVVSVEIMK